MSEMHDGAQASAAQGADHGDMPEMLQRIGHLTRMLRESMRELGLDKGVELSLIHISEPTRPRRQSRMPSSA